VNHITGCAGLDDRLRQDLAEVRDLTLDLRDRRDRGGTSIEIVGETLDRDHPVRIQQQDRERRPLLAPPETNRAIVSDDFERSEDAEIDHRPGP